MLRFMSLIRNLHTVLLLFTVSFQNMSGDTFKDLFEGKQHRLEWKINANEDLLGKLREYRIITELQRQQIEVICTFQ